MVFRAYLHSPPDDLSVQPVIVCKDAASGILDVVTLYDQCYGLRYAPILYLNHIYAAALVHVNELPEEQSLKFFLKCMRYIRTMGNVFKRPAEIAFNAMLSILMERNISLPSRVREELNGVIALDVFETLFVEKSLETTGHEPFAMPDLGSSSRSTPLAEYNQQATLDHSGSFPFSEDRGTPGEDFLVGELAFGSGLLPDLLDDDDDDTFGRHW